MNDDETKAAIAALNKSDIDGREIVVKEAEDRWLSQGFGPQGVAVEGSSPLQNSRAFDPTTSGPAFD